MKLRLFVSESFAPCREAERIWSEIAAEQGVELAIVDVNEDGGRALAARLRVNMVPAVATEDRLLAIGVQTPAEARALLAEVAAEGREMR